RSGSTRRSATATTRSARCATSSASCSSACRSSASSSVRRTRRRSVSTRPSGCSAAGRTGRSSSDVEKLLLARHAESEYSARGALNGDPWIVVARTEEGRAQARLLGERLADEPIDLCAVTAFARTRETAEIALAGRDVPIVVVPELNDHPAGSYEGR